MLWHYFAKMRERSAVKAVRSFLYSDFYLLVVVALMACANIFGLEIPVYYAYFLFCLLIVLFAEDCFPIMPMACCGYMTFSAKNNPAKHVGETMFANPAITAQFIAIAAVIAVILTVRLVFELRVKRRGRFPLLTFGFFALGASYLLGGAFTSFYGLRTVLFGIVQIISLSLFYFYLSVTVDWGKRRAGDCIKVFTAVGGGLALEAFAMYLTPEVLNAFAEGTFNRGYLVTGWGVYNNVGGMLVLCLPAPFYFAATKRHGWVYSLFGSELMLAILFTQSRNSILCGAILYLACMTVVLVKSREYERFHHFLVNVAFILGIALAIVILRDSLGASFLRLFQEFFQGESRLQIYRDGLKEFVKNPIFGNGWYEGLGAIYGNLPSTSFLPPRYHNTYVQLFASGGVVAMGAYLFHRGQTVALFLQKPTTEKSFVGLCVLALVLISFLDCHFFNFGPGLLYSCLLVSAENACPSSRK